MVNLKDVPAILWGATLGAGAGALAPDNLAHASFGDYDLRPAESFGLGWRDTYAGIFNGSVRSLFPTEGGSVIAIGNFDTIAPDSSSGGESGFRGIAEHTPGHGWCRLGDGLYSATGNKGGPLPIAIVNYEGSIVVGGTFTTADGANADYLLRWDGSRWSPMGQPLSGGVHGLAVQQDQLYVAGVKFGTEGNNPVNTSYVMRWQDSCADWEDISATLGSGVITGIYSNNTELYIFGQFPDRRATVLRRRDEGWVSVGTNMPEGVVFTLAESKGELYAGGYFTLTAGPEVVSRHIAKLDPNRNEWVPLGVEQGLNGPCFSLVPFDNTLVAGGPFTLAGSVPTPHLATWGGATWQPFLSELPGAVETIVPGPNGETLLVGLSNGVACAAPESETEPPIRESFGVELYPNPVRLPASDILVKLTFADGLIPSMQSDGAIQVIGVDGREKHSTRFKIDCGTSQLISFNPNNLEPGVYFLRLSAGDLRASSRLVVY